MVSKYVRFLVFILVCFMIIPKGFAQRDTTQPLRIAVLAPIYLDSAFMYTEYSAGNTLPKAMMPGLDFYNGVMMAVDSLQKENVPVEVWVYDTKMNNGNTDMLKIEMEDKGFSLIIGYLSSALEQQSLADFAFKKNIAFISGTYPNDAGLTGNPYFAVVNPTLKTNVESIYKYVQRNAAGSNVYYVSKPGAMETKVKNYFDGAKAKFAAFKYTPVVLPYNFSPGDILPHIDTGIASIVVCGSLDKSFGLSLLQALSTVSSASNKITVVGMPTWDGLDALAGEDCKNLVIIYSTPYNFRRSDKYISALSKDYRAKFNGRPSDMVFKGFEQMYHFSHLLVKYRDSLFNNLSDTSYKISCDFNFQPVRLTATSYAPDYLENKKLYFVKMLNGSIKAVN